MLSAHTIRRVPASALRRFLRDEATGGILLLIAAVLAMIAANSRLSEAYFAALHLAIGPMSLLHWTNDGLMALFFLLVGLEIKRELVDGRLASWPDRTLPAIAALSGMAVPALIYLGIAASTPGLARGWAIPTATDIAFAIGIMALLGSRAPTSLKLFLTTVAIVDDLGAVVIIAAAYTTNLNGSALLAAVLVLAAMFLLNRMGVKNLWPYLAFFVLLWIAVLLSGVHATISGVLAASAIPIKRSPGAPDARDSPLHRLEHRLHPWVAFLVVPVFGFANAGVSLGGTGIADVLRPLPLGVALGLFLGKQLGVLGAVWLCHRLGIACKPRNATWMQVYGTSLLCGIGFTMSLFIGGLAFGGSQLMEAVKIGVLGGSLLAGLAGFCVLRFSPSDAPSAMIRRTRPPAPDESGGPK